MVDDTQVAAPVGGTPSYSPCSDDGPQIDFFVSYTLSDLSWARWLTEVVEDLGYTTRYQARDFPLGVDFMLGMHQCIRAAQRVIAVLTPAYEKSRFGMKEAMAAEKAGKLIPVLVESYTPQALLGTISHISLVDKDEAEAAEELQTRLGVVHASGTRRLERHLGRQRHAYPAQLHPVPTASAPLFGRDHELGNVESLLNDRTGPVAIVPDQADASGRGCTALAADFVRARAGRYARVCWVHASPPDLLPIEYWRLGSELGLPPQKRVRDAVNAKLSELAERDKVLIVFDDAPKLGEIEEWLPDQKVDCLLTSASTAYAGQRNLVEMGPLALEDAVEALQSDNPRSTVDQLTELVTALEYEPQAVGLASAYLRAAGTDIPTYLRKLEVEKGEHESTLTAARALTLAHLGKVEPAALKFLALLAYGARRPFPLNVLATTNAAGINPAAGATLASRQTRIEALEAMTRLGLAHEVQDALAISAWAGNSAQRSLQPDEAADMAEAAIVIFGTALASAMKTGNDELADQLAPHVRSALEGVPATVPIRHQLRARIHLTRYLTRIAQHDLAREVISRGVDLATTAEFEVDAVILVDVLKESAAANEAASRSAEALHDLEQARHRIGFLDAAAAVGLLSDLGSLLARLGKKTEALQAFDDASRRFSEDDSGEDQRLAWLSARSDAFEGWNELDEALSIVDERVRDAQVRDGKKGRRTVEAIADRGRLRGRLGRREEALQDLNFAVEQLASGKDLRLPDTLVEYGSLLVEEARQQRAEVDGAPGSKDPSHPSTESSDFDTTVSTAHLTLARAAVLYSARYGRDCIQNMGILRCLADVYEIAGDSDRSSQLRYEAGLVSRPGSALLPEADTLRPLVKAIRSSKCTAVLGPGLTDRLFTPREHIAKRWAEAEAYPMEPYRQTDLPNIAEFLSITSPEEDVRNRLKAHIAGELMDTYELGLPYDITSKPDDAELEEVISSVGNLARWLDPFEHHAVLASLPIKIYIVAGGSDLLIDALRERGKDPNAVICDWRRSDKQGSPKKGAPAEKYDDVPTVDNPMVIHIFGHLGRPGSITLTERDFIQFIIELSKSTKGIPSAVRTALIDDSLLILGFQLDDWAFHILFQSLINQPGSYAGSHQESVAVNVSREDRWINEEAAQRYLQRYFSRRKVGILWSDLDTVICQLSRMAAE